MSKYDKIKTLKETKATATHQCDYCGKIIESGDIYYPEKVKDKFLHFLHNKKFCSECYEKYGEDLLKMETKQNKKKKLSEEQRSLENFNY